MKLVHFSSNPIKKVYSTPRDEAGFGNKPNGLWVSDEEDHGWRTWCNDNDYGHGEGAFDHAYEVKLAPNANILYIKNALELLKFTHEYKAKSPMNGTRAGVVREYEIVYDIDWPRVMEKYQGIIITPYIWELRLEMLTSWYYGWDCASGCIWDAEAVERIKLLDMESTKNENI